MQRSIILATVAGVAVVAGIYFRQGSMEQQASPAPTANESRADGAGIAATPPQPASADTRADTHAQFAPPVAKQIPSDPRLRDLMVSADNGLIEFVKGPDGKVIKEIDKDPNSLGFKKPLREYTYA